MPQDQDQRVRPDRIQQHEQEQDRGKMVAKERHLVLWIKEQAAMDRLPDDVVHDAEVVKVAVAARVPDARRHADHNEAGEHEQPEGPWALDVTGTRFHFITYAARIRL